MKEKKDAGMTQALADEEPGLLLTAEAQAMVVKKGKGKALEVVRAAMTPACFECVLDVANEKVMHTLGTCDIAEPFVDDVDYLQAIEFGLIAHYQTFLCRYGSVSALVKKEMQATAVTVRELNAGMHCVKNAIAVLVCGRLRLMKKLPLALRLCRELELTPAERRGFIFVLICHGGVEIRTVTDVRPSAYMLAKMSGMNSHDFLAFLAEDRAHFKQGLLASTDGRMKRVTSHSHLKMAEEVVEALYNVKLTETSFLKLDKTPLATMLEAEGLVEFGLESDPDDCEGFVEEEMEEDDVDSQGQPDDAAQPAAQSPPLHPAARKRKRAEPPGSGPAAAKVPRGPDQPAETAPAAAAGARPLAKPQAPASASAAASAPAAAAPAAGTTTIGDARRSTASPAPDDETGLVLPVWKGNSRDTADGPLSLDLGPYADNFEYLDDFFKLLATTIRLRTTETDMKDDDPEMASLSKSKQEEKLRELKGRVRVWKRRIERRMQKTRQAGAFAPTMEELQRQRGFSNFEKMVLLLLVSNIMSHDVLIAANTKYIMRGEAQRECTVGFILFVLCESLEERIHRRKVFYKNAPLLSDGMITVIGKTYGGDLMDCTVEIDRRMVDSLMGLQTEFSEMVEASHLYTPKVKMENVILPNEQKNTILNHISNYDAFQRCKKKVGIEEIISYGTGLVLLFYGPSGTGKTMLANAIARDMQKKVLLVSLRGIKSSGRSSELLRFVFREAKLNNAIVFFDECDMFFEARETNSEIPALLTELEKYSGIMVLATNKAHALDEAMNRRITLAIEFRLPDHQMRCEIWKRHIPPALKISENIDWSSLATDYELSGGLIKNALLTSISHAVARESGNIDPLLKMEDLVHGAKEQLRSFFNKDSSQPNLLIPKRALEDCIYDTSVRTKLLEVVQRYKGGKHIQSMWGFREDNVSELNSVILLYGPSGVGKSLAAEAIGYECGHVVRVINVSIFKSGSSTLEKVFEEAAKCGAILVLDEAQELLSYTAENQEALTLLNYHAKLFTKPVLVIARTETESAVDPKEVGLRCQLAIRFPVQGEQLRLLHWQRVFPKDTPMDPSVDFAHAAKTVLTPGAIRNAAYFAACKAAMQPVHKRVVTKAILEEAIAEVIRLARKTHSTIYS